MIPWRSWRDCSAESRSVFEIRALCSAYQSWTKTLINAAQNFKIALFRREGKRGKRLSFWFAHARAKSGQATEQTEACAALFRVQRLIDYLGS
jgi:hypothetical protein